MEILAAAERRYPRRRPRRHRHRRLTPACSRPEGFAVSGVLLLAVSGGLGGGLIRDVLLGDLPPVAMTNQAYLPTVAIAAAVTFFFSGWLARLTTPARSWTSRWASPSSARRRRRSPACRAPRSSSSGR